MEHRQSSHPGKFANVCYVHSENLLSLSWLSSDDGEAEVLRTDAMQYLLLKRFNREGGPPTALVRFV